MVLSGALFCCALVRYGYQGNAGFIEFLCKNYLLYFFLLFYTVKEALGLILLQMFHTLAMKPCALSFSLVEDLQMPN